MIVDRFSSGDLSIVQATKPDGSLLSPILSGVRLGATREFSLASANTRVAEKKRGKTDA